MYPRCRKELGDAGVPSSLGQLGDRSTRSTLQSAARLRATSALPSVEQSSSTTVASTMGASARRHDGSMCASSRTCDQQGCETIRCDSLPLWPSLWVLIEKETGREPLPLDSRQMIWVLMHSVCLAYRDEGHNLAESAPHSTRISTSALPFSLGCIEPDLARCLEVFQVILPAYPDDAAQKHQQNRRCTTPAWRHLASPPQLRTL